MRNGVLQGCMPRCYCQVIDNTCRQSMAESLRYLQAMMNFEACIESIRKRCDVQARTGQGKIGGSGMETFIVIIVLKVRFWRALRFCPSHTLLVTSIQAR